MTSRPERIPGRLVVLIPLLLALGAVSLLASVPSEDEVKAAFIFNFVKFVEWPEMAEKKEIKVCFTGEKPLSGNLTLLEGRKAHNLVLKISSGSVPPEDICDVLFLSASDRKSLSELLIFYSEKPVLTISDVPGFARSGGMIGLVVVDNKVRFEINLSAVNKSQLKISSQLLSLAKEVYK